MSNDPAPDPVTIPEVFIRSSYLSIQQAVATFRSLSPISQELCKTTSNRLQGGAHTDLLILEMLANDEASHLDFLNALRWEYAVETEMAFDDVNCYEGKDFIRLKNHSFFRLFIPGLVCRIEDFDMYRFTDFGSNPSKYPSTSLDEPHSNHKKLPHVDRLFKEAKELTPSLFAKFIDDVLRAAYTMENDRINFSLLWRLYDSTHNDKKQPASKEDVLRLYLKSNPNARAFLSVQGEIWVSRERELSLMKLISRDERLEYPTSPNFVKYKKYLLTMMNSITHAKCAGKFTRVSKLYSKPLTFTFKTPNQDQREFSSSVNKKYFKKFNKTFFINQSQRNNIRRYERELENQRKSMEKIETTLSEMPDNSHHSAMLSERLSAQKAEYNRTNNLLTKFLDNFASLGNHDAVLDGEAFQKWQHTSGGATTPLVINGGAGMGKTIRLTQFALSLATELLRAHESPHKSDKTAFPLPIFLKAKRCVSWDFLNQLRHGNFHPNQISQILVEMMVKSTPALVNHHSIDELTDALGGWIRHQHLHQSGFVFFVDGLDECPSEDAASKLINWFKNIESVIPSSLVLSTRPSHYRIAAELLGDHGLVEMLTNKEYYTKEELSHEIPTRLCDAWGLTRSSARALASVFSAYESILQHPLFVGWFCFLILTDEFDGLESGEDETEIAQNNLITKIISIGIKSSLERREAEFTGSDEDPASEEFLRILRTFVAVAFHFNLARPDQIYQQMKLLKLVDEVPPSIRYSIEVHCGILFLTGDHIEWTHQTIPELMYADFQFNHTELHRWGPLKGTAPVVSRLAQLSFESGAAETYKQAMVRYSLPHQHAVFNELRIDAWIDCENEGRYLVDLDGDGNLIPIVEGNKPYEVELATLFIKNLGTASCFPVYYDVFEPSKKREIVRSILVHSNDPFGRDLITPEDEFNLVHADDVKTELVLRSTKIRDCIEYYRMILADFGCLPESKLDLEHDVFSIHKKALNSKSIFYINHLSGWVKYMTEGDHAMTWLRPWLHESLRCPDPEFYSNERIQLIQFITEQYVETAYKALFGEAHWVDLLNMMYEETHLAEIDVVVGSGEYVDVQRRNLLNHYMAKHYLNDLISHETFHPAPVDIMEFYDTENIHVRGIVMMPFIAVCLEFMEGNEDHDLAQLLEEWPEFSAFNLISNHASRLISTDEQS